jgi:hypothetical protein
MTQLVTAWNARAWCAAPRTATTAASCWWRPTDAGLDLLRRRVVERADTAQHMLDRLDPQDQAELPPLARRLRFPRLLGEPARTGTRQVAVTPSYRGASPSRPPASTRPRRAVASQPAEDDSGGVLRRPAGSRPERSTSRHQTGNGFKERSPGSPTVLRRAADPEPHPSELTAGIGLDDSPVRRAADPPAAREPAGPDGRIQQPCPRWPPMPRAALRSCVVRAGIRFGFVRRLRGARVATTNR